MDAQRQQGSNKQLYFWIAALIIGGILGMLGNGTINEMCDFVATIFTRLFQFIAVPTIALAVITTLASLGAEKNTGKIFVRTITYTLLTTFAASFVALALYIIIAPGNLPSDLIGAAAGATKKYASLSYYNHFLNVVPNNMVRPFLEGNVLSVLSIAGAVGMGIACAPKNENREVVLKFVFGLQEVLFTMIRGLMKVLPIGIVAFAAQLSAQIEAGVIVGALLRRYIERIGYGSNFTIYDADDQKSIMKDICKRLNVNTKMYKERTLLGAISSAKDELVSPEEFALKAQSDFKLKVYSEVYTEYQRELKSNNALDFDDLICRTVELFQSCPEVLDYYQERFRFIMVDEYQDTNTAQFKLVSLLASKYQNLCVVGDDDQSIYKFRGANIGNILNFEHFFPDAKVIRLEQNYRSTQNILNTANEVICHNKGRKEKRLWTANGEGSKVKFRQFMNAFEEAEYVAGMINGKVSQSKWKYGDCAILYRTNAQSRMFEEKFLFSNIPYKIVGGINFYSRKEIKDVLAYLKTIANGSDDLAVRRIINVPKRGIGATTISRVQEFAIAHGISFYNALRTCDQIPGIGKGASKLLNFVELIQIFRSKAEFYSVKELIEDILEVTGYRSELELEGTDEARERLENIDELLSKAAAYDESQEEPTLDGFLEEVALVADIDSLEDDADHVLMMTLHSAKGLEFPVVFLVGMEDGMFPSYMSIASEDPLDLEEERRLCYVGITRAMQELTLTAARQRMVRGETHYM